MILGEVRGDDVDSSSSVEMRRPRTSLPRGLARLYPPSGCRGELSIWITFTSDFAAPKLVPRMGDESGSKSINDEELVLFGFLRGRASESLVSSSFLCLTELERDEDAVVESVGTAGFRPKVRISCCINFPRKTDEEVATDGIRGSP